MKIWLTGDLHFNKKQFNYLVNNQSRFDILCLAGDFLNIKLGGFVEQTEWICNFLEQFKKPVLCCSGNHDLSDNNKCKWMNNIKNSKVYIDNRRPKINGIRFGIMPYLVTEYSRFYDCDILLTHVPPKNIKVAQEGSKENYRDWGDEELYQLLKHRVLAPKYMLCGHVEKPLSQTDVIGKTVVINPGASHSGDKPYIYEIKL